MHLSRYFVAAILAALIVAGFTGEDAQAEELLASWYGPGFEGNLTASGDVFDPYNEYTAASPYLPFGTVLTVCYDGCVEVEITDRGPYVGGRDLDLSAIAAEEIARRRMPGWMACRSIKGSSSGTGTRTPTDGC